MKLSFSKKELIASSIALLAMGVLTPLASAHTWYKEDIPLEGGRLGAAAPVGMGVDSDRKVHIFYFDFAKFLPQYISGKGKDWQPPESVDKGYFAYKSFPLAVDSKNQVHVCYSKIKQDSRTDTEIWYATKKKEEWEWKAVPIKDSMSQYCDISVDREGTAHIVYTQNEEVGKEYIKYTSIDSNNSFSQSSQTVDGPLRGEVAYPAIAVDNSPNPNIHIAYEAIKLAQPDRGFLKYAVKSKGDVEWDQEIIAENGINGGGIDVAAQGGKVHISYYNSLIKSVQYVTGRRSSWIFRGEIGYQETGDPNVNTSIAVENEVERVHFAYFSNSKYLYHTSYYKGIWKQDLIEQEEEKNQNIKPTLAIDSMDRIHVVYSKDRHLKYATTNLPLPGPDITVSPTSVNFPNHPFGAGCSLTKIVTISNKGTENLRVTISKVTGRAQEFDVSQSPGSSFWLEPQDYQEIKVQFCPSVEVGIPLSAYINLVSNDPDTGDFSIGMYGTVIPISPSWRHFREYNRFPWPPYSRPPYVPYFMPQYLPRVLR